MAHILNQKVPMEYRRFGKTEFMLSVITLGGMRYVHGWDQPRDEIPTAMIDNAIECVTLALENGINQIETADGYMKSESCYGKVLNDELSIPRDSYYLMTKGVIDSGSKMRKLVEEQLKRLKTNYFDTYAFHGVNNAELLKLCRKKKGPIEELLKLKEEGVIKHVGFSTHGPLEVICGAIETGFFDFVNLHYYYFF